MCNNQLDLFGQKEITASHLSEQLSTDTKGVLGLVSEGLKESLLDDMSLTPINILKLRITIWYSKKQNSRISR